MCPEKQFVNKLRQNKIEIDVVIIQIYLNFLIIIIIKYVFRII